MSSLYGFTADNFMGQLPAVLYDDARMNALASAIAKALEARLDELPLAEIYTRIDALPEALLDILARDFSIDWYDYDSPIEAKRNLIIKRPPCQDHEPKNLREPVFSIMQHFGQFPYTARTI